MPVGDVPDPPDGWVSAWTDGSGQGWDRPGGAGVVIVDAGVVVIEASLPLDRASSQGAEVAAIGLALGVTNPARDLMIYSDSEFSIRAMSNPQWDIRHRLLARWIHEAHWRLRGRQVRFTHVKGHSGIALNVRADILAGRARQQALAKNQAM
jgi:ribonuclease HI